MNRNEAFNLAASALGLDPNADLRIGGNYTSLLQEDHLIYISGQIPRIGDVVMVTGRVGEEVSVAEAQRAAEICVMRALTLSLQHLGDLDKLKRVLRMNVYVQSANGFTQQSEVADGASNLLRKILGEAGVHTRTSVGVFQLPKNAAVEIDMVIALHRSAPA
ncbi:MAG: RidA family protein [Burkholderiaceae bacterium]|nr:RidA family protein [Burkholderiaceae bacterium]